MERKALDKPPCSDVRRPPRAEIGISALADRWLQAELPCASAAPGCTPCPQRADAWYHGYWGMSTDIFCHVQPL